MYTEDVFENLHALVVTKIVLARRSGHRLSAEAKDALCEQVLEHQDAFASPFQCRQRDSATGLNQLSQNLMPEATDSNQLAVEVHYRECTFLALCLFDLSQNLHFSVCHKIFHVINKKSNIATELLEAIANYLRHAGSIDSTTLHYRRLVVPFLQSMLRTLVDTLVMYFHFFRGTPEHFEQIIALIPQVIEAGSTPSIGSPTLSDIVHFDQGELSGTLTMKLCMCLVMICQPGQKTGISETPPEHDSAKRPESRITNSAEREREPDRAQSPVLTAVSEKLKDKYWNESLPFGQLLSFMINGVFLNDSMSKGAAFTHWHLFDGTFATLFSQEALVTTCVGQTIVSVLSDVLVLAFPLAQWSTLKRLESSAQKRYSHIKTDSFQVSVLRCFNQLCVLHPKTCERICDIVIHCTDSYHMPITGSKAAVATLSLYQEILELIVTCSRGTLACSRRLAQKILTHSNQWFNLGFLQNCIQQETRGQRKLFDIHNGYDGSDMADGNDFMSGLVKETQPLTLEVLPSVVRVIGAVFNTHLWCCIPPPRPFVVTEWSGNAIVDLLMKDLGSNAGRLKAACLNALSVMEYSTDMAKDTFEKLAQLLPALSADVLDVRNNGACVAIEVLSLGVTLVHSIALREHRFQLNGLHAFTVFVIQFILLRILSEEPPPGDNGSGNGFWRLATLSLKWIRCMLRGPLPLQDSEGLNQLLLKQFPGQGNPMQESATTFAFRCLLSFDSPAFSRIMNLTLLHGACSAGLQKNSYKEQTVFVGFDIIRILCQRDALFTTLFQRHAQLRRTEFKLVHELLFQQYPFQYPREQSTMGEQNPFVTQSSRRTEKAEGFQRTYIMLLLDYCCEQNKSFPKISKLVVYLLHQLTLRNPVMMARSMELHFDLLHTLVCSFASCLVEPQYDDAVYRMPHLPSEWCSKAEDEFLFEVANSSVANYDQGVCSFLTGLPVGQRLETAWQIHDDACVELGDLGALDAIHNGKRALQQITEDAYLVSLRKDSRWFHNNGSLEDDTIPTLKCISTRRLVLAFLHYCVRSTASTALRQLGHRFFGLDPITYDIDTWAQNDTSCFNALMLLLGNQPEIPLLSGVLHTSELFDDRQFVETQQQHLAFEAALMIAHSLFTNEDTQDVTLRYVVYSWDCRYNLLWGLLGLPWNDVPPILQRTLLTQTAYALLTLSTELQVVSETIRFGKAQSGKDKQRLSIVHKVGEYLMFAVQRFFDDDQNSFVVNSVTLLNDVFRSAEAGDFVMSKEVNGILERSKDMHFQKSLSVLSEKLRNGFNRFVRAAFLHFKTAPELTNELRVRICLSHCEALLPFFHDDAISQTSSESLAFLVTLLADFVEQLLERVAGTTQNTRDMVPAAVFQTVMQALVKATVQHRMTQDARATVYTTLSEVLRKMIPADITPDEEQIHHQWVDTTMNTPHLCPLVHLLIKDATAPASGTTAALDLLSSLAAHMPARLATIFELPQTWGHFKLFVDTFFDNPSRSPAVALFVAQIVAEFKVALRFFEYGCLEELLTMDLRALPVYSSASSVGHVIEIPHPAALSAILQVIIMLLVTMPKHRMVLTRVTQWLEYHHKLAFEILSIMPRLTGNKSKFNADHKPRSNHDQYRYNTFPPPPTNYQFNMERSRSPYRTRCADDHTEQNGAPVPPAGQASGSQHHAAPSLPEVYHVGVLLLELVCLLASTCQGDGRSALLDVHSSPMMHCVLTILEIKVKRRGDGSAANEADGSAQGGRKADIDTVLVRAPDSHPQQHALAYPHTHTHHALI
eukprot:GEMP01001116.1.p1 GENE.GEMP01001116.1~~GEMP01001116.1.p1  ORF type:complete len:1786 (+),score=372.56 GEMP01001116.1:59-5359(+)